MSQDPIRNEPVSQIGPQTDPESELHREVERLRGQLAKVTAEAESYRRAAYALLNKQFPYSPPTD
jgi:hypothetical protein